VQMPPPAFGVLELFGQPADFEGHVIHRAQIGVQSLADIQPVLLAPVFSERREFYFLDGFSIHKSARQNSSAQTVAQSVRHAVINGYVAVIHRPMGN